MTNDPLPTQDHIVRYVPGGRIASDGRITGAAFQLKPDEKYLSVNWIEFLKLPDREAQLAEIRRVLSGKMTLGATAKLAVLNVGNAITRVRCESQDSRELQITHQPLPNEDDPLHIDPSHSGIFNLDPDDLTISELIAEAVSSSDIYPARSPYVDRHG